MPDDPPTQDDDSMGSEEQQSAHSAPPGEVPADAEHIASPPELATPASSNGDVRPDSAKKDEPNAESESTAQQESGQPETDSESRTWSDDVVEVWETPDETSSYDEGERWLALERPKDAQANIDTRPPDDEAVTFRSVTVAEIYVGQTVRSFMTAFSAIDWIRFDGTFLDDIAGVQKGFRYSQGLFGLASDTSRGFDFGYGRTSLPSGIDRILGVYYVLGPSIVAVVFTFVLASDEAMRLDAALRNDGESRLDRLGPTLFSMKTVRNVKRERIGDVLDQVIRRCLTWLNDRMPGTLSANKEGFGPPTCALVSLAVGRPLDTQAGYMALLGLWRRFAEKFVSHDFLFLLGPFFRVAGRWMTAAFNEADATGHGWPSDHGAAEDFGLLISCFMMAEGLEAVLLSFELRLRDVRADLDRLDFDKATGSQVIALRNRLLGISRDLSIVSSDLTVLLGDKRMWRDFSPLAQVLPNGSASATADTTARTTRRELRAIMESLQAQEVGLRELILVTSASISETRNLELQTKVLGLTNKLNGLTRWLIILTVVLVILGVAALVVQIVNAPAAPVNVTPASHAPPRTASPTPRPSASPSGSGRVPSGGASSRF
jgi:hypothetical protein